MGKVDKDGFLLDVRLEGKFKSIEDVEDLVVGYAPATLLTSGVAGLPNPAPAGASASRSCPASSHGSCKTQGCSF